MKNETKKPYDPVFEICANMLAESPEASYARLNPALRSTLSNCIAADLPFRPDTFQRIYYELRGGRWFGDGAGSATGEYFYSTACEVNHLSACISFENYAHRPGVLWEEKVGTPFRLHVGARFSWQGHYVEVTSMRKDSLVACTYQDIRDEVRGLKVGAIIGYDDPVVVTSVKKDGNETVLRVIKAPGQRGDRTVNRRFTITYKEIAEFRKTAKARVKAMVEKIAACIPDKDGAKLSKEVSAGHFRHFELEEINAAFAKRKDWLASQEKIVKWRAGFDGAWLDSKSILLRVSKDGGSVDCSNGNHVSVAAAKRVIPVVLARRKESGTLNLPLDSFTVNSVSEKGARVGCTLVPWDEIEYVAKILDVA